LHDGNITGYVKVARDLTERRQMEERLEATVEERTTQVRELVTQLTKSEQEERHRISSILHDDLQQRLFSLNFQLQAVRDAAARSAADELQKALAEIEEGLQGAIQITRELSVDLSPPVLHNEGLVAAMSWLTTRMRQQHGLDVQVQAHEPLPVPSDDLRVLLFQVVRELLFNVVKHAGTLQAEVVLAEAGKDIEILVSDGGQGFSSAIVDQSSVGGQGLERIRQRLQLLGGRMNIVSAPGKGTRITVYSPLNFGGDGKT
jgi:signal transduction histidine kinase